MAFRCQQESLRELTSSRSAAALLLSVVDPCTAQLERMFSWPRIRIQCRLSWQMWVTCKRLLTAWIALTPKHQVASVTTSAEVLGD